MANSTLPATQAASPPTAAVPTPPALIPTPTPSISPPASASAAASSSSSPPLAFDPSLLLAPSFDPHSFITASLSPSTSLPQLHSSLTSYTSQLHLQLVSYLNAHYERFIALSSSLTPLPDLLSSLDDWAVTVKEKTAAVHLITADATREISERLLERSEGEERQRWLLLLHSLTERVLTAQAVLSEVEEDREAGLRDAAPPISGDDPLTALPPIKPGLRAATRLALSRARDGGGGEERRRREERRAKRRGEGEGGEGAGGEEDDDEDVEDWQADEAVKRQHNQAYDLFLALITAPTPSPHPPPSPALLSRLTHLALLLVSIRTSLALTSSFSLIAQLLPTIHTLSTSTHAHLQRALIDALHPDAPSNALRSLLRLYLLLDAAPEAQGIVKEHILHPQLSALITPANLKSPPTSTPPLLSNLQWVYSQVEVLAERLLPTLQSASDFSPHSFDWWGDVFFSAVSTALVALGPALFSPGGPALFHFHYSLTTQFLDRLSSLASASGVGDLMRRPVVDAFLRRWNTGIYFRLRFQAIAQGVEAACARPPVGEGEGGAGGAALEAVRAALAQCWSESVWLPELSHPFMRLSLQCLERFAAMVEAACVTAVQAGGEGGEGGALTAAIPAPALFALYVDVRALIAYVSTTLPSLITARLGPSNADLVHPTLAPALTRLQALPPLVQSTLTSILSHHCSTPLAQIARLPTVYRMTAKRPTAPSPYVPQLLKALAGVTASPAASAWPAEDRAGLTKAVVVAVVGVMGEKVTQVLELAVRTEASLRMLRRGGAGAGGAAGGEMTEVDKIRGQLVMDVKELQRGVSDELGLHDIPQLTELADTVRTAGLSTTSS